MTTPTQLSIALVAGEASGDLLGSHLLAALKTRLPDARFVGIGGPKMQAQGLISWFPMETLAVRGYVEVLSNLRTLLQIRRELKQRLLQDKPAVFIGIDAPDFNLNLEIDLKRAGIPVIHYVSPSIWAWRMQRIHKIKRAVSHILALFPFEVVLYEAVSVPVTYVGHPLADMIPFEWDKQAARELMRLPVSATIFTLMPGSRQSELRYMADTFIETAKIIHYLMPESLFLVPMISCETRALFEQALTRCSAHALPFKMIFGHAQMAIAVADTVLVASGTATLEVALIKRPMVITYKMATLTYWLMKRKQLQSFIGLPNILAGKALVPEILQRDATPENLAQALIASIEPTHQAQLKEAFEALHISLRQNTAEKAANIVCQYV